MQKGLGVALVQRRESRRNNKHQLINCFSKKSSVAALFLCCLFLEPLFASIPPYATAPALVFVAASFLAPLRDLDWEDMAVVMPVMLMAILMPLTFSIAASIAIGFLAYVLIHILAGRAQSINTGTFVITGFGCLWMIIPFI